MKRGAGETPSIHTKLWACRAPNWASWTTEFSTGLSKRCEVNSSSLSRKAVFTINIICFLSVYYYKQLRCLYLPKIAGRNKAGLTHRHTQPPHLSLKTSFTFAIFTCVLPRGLRHLENQANQKTVEKKGRHAHK